MTRRKELCRLRSAISRKRRAYGGYRHWLEVREVMEIIYDRGEGSFVGWDRWKGRVLCISLGGKVSVRWGKDGLPYMTQRGTPALAWGNHCPGMIVPSECWDGHGVFTSWLVVVPR